MIKILLFCFKIHLYLIQTTLFIPTVDKTTKFVIMTISQNLRLRGNNSHKLCKTTVIHTIKKYMFWIFSEMPQYGESNKYPKQKFFEEIRTKQDLSYKSICSICILYDSKFILMAMSLGTNAVIVTRVHCISLLSFQRPGYLVSRSCLMRYFTVMYTLTINPFMPSVQ